MNLLSDIEKIISEGKAPELQWIDEMARQYPYFSLPLLLQLKHGGNDEMMQHLAVMSPDRRDLAIVVGKAPASFAGFYPGEERKSPSSDEAIDIFLNSFAGGSNQKEIDALSNAIFNPTPDYADILAAQQDGTSAAADKEDELIDSFIAHSRRQEQETIARNPQAEHHIEQEEVTQVAHDAVENSTQNDSSMLSESLAKMYIARKKYSKALEIIESINLNFPEKSIYFADQIRFLRKIVLNQNIKNKL